MAFDPKNLGESNEETTRAVDEHLSKYGFKATHAIQQPLEEQQFVYVTVWICPPTPERPMVTMYTTGMSDLRMAVPPDHEDLAHAELVMFLPPDWPIGGSGVGQEIRGPDGAVLGVIPNIPSAGVSAVQDPRLAWSRLWLQIIARYPHAERTWVGPGHMIPTGESKPLPGTGFSGFVLLEPLAFPYEVVAPDGRRIQLHTLFPLYPEEMKFKRKNGTPELLRRFAEAGLSEIADPKRANVGDKKPGWRFW